MYYCKPGEVLVVNALYDDLRREYFRQISLRKPSLEVTEASTKNRIEIPHKSIVMALEASVPPWYSCDNVRCLWEEKVVFIKRVALKKANACYST